MQHNLELTFRIDGDHVEADVYEPESGDIAWFEFMLSPDEHPEFNDKIGNEIYSWLKLLIAMAIVYSTTCFKKAIEFIVQIVMKNIRRNIYEA